MQIEDPDAEKPEDWDDDLDGEWEAPTIDNPEYKGEWKPKQIDNPDYEGPWVHPMIDNPDYEADDTLYLYKDIGGVGIELWQVKSGTIFDNILVTDSVEEAEEHAATYWKAMKVRGGPARFPLSEPVLLTLWLCVIVYRMARRRCGTRLRRSARPRRRKSARSVRRSARRARPRKPKRMRRKTKRTRMTRTGRMRSRRMRPRRRTSSRSLTPLHSILAWCSGVCVCRLVSFCPLKLLETGLSLQWASARCGSIKIEQKQNIWSPLRLGYGAIIIQVFTVSDIRSLARWTALTANQSVLMLIVNRLVRARTGEDDLRNTLSHRHRIAHTDTLTHTVPAIAQLCPHVVVAALEH